MKAQIAACIFIGLTQQCLSDETLFTCRGGSGHGYTAEGGYSKPGWSVSEWKREEKTIKLIQKQPARGGFFDIQYGTSTRLLSFLEDGCRIEREFDDAHPLDRAFVVRCEEGISTFLFHTRSGVDQLLETHLGLFSDVTIASVSMTKDCKRGDQDFSPASPCQPNKECTVNPPAIGGTGNSGRTLAEGWNQSAPARVDDFRT
jgi:hypothetical protein